MKFPDRRQVLHLAAGAAVLSPLLRMAKAQAYPNAAVALHRWIRPRRWNLGLTATPLSADTSQQPLLNGAHRDYSENRRF
jgi:hypothetical protein